jgi:hypothetical protein
MMYIPRPVLPAGAGGGAGDGLRLSLRESAVITESLR